MDQPTTRRTNRRLALLAATGGERQVDRTLMAAWAVRQRHPDAAVAVVTGAPSHRLWRTGLFNIVVSAGAGDPDFNPADCCLAALDKGVFERAVYLDSHCRLRSDNMNPAFAALDAADIALVRSGGSVSDGVLMLRRGAGARAALQDWSARMRAGEAADVALAEAVGRAGAGSLPEDWYPRASRGEGDRPLVEVRRGDVSRLYAELLNFALHRLLSGDIKRAAAVYARVALATRPDLPQLGPERLLDHLDALFARRLPDMGTSGRKQLDELLHRVASEDPAGNLLAIAALHLEMGQVKTAIAVLRMIHRMHFDKPAPLPS